ncbi:MAG: DUF559 domain-containing protein, partial [Actinobacteria bacterium]
RSAHPGTARLRAALEVDGLGRDRTKSQLEKRFLQLARQTGLPAPAINAWMQIPGEEMQCDFVWHRERVVVEVDAWEAHGTRRAFRNDRRRDRVLRAHGWEPVRVTGYDVLRRRRSHQRGPGPPGTGRITDDGWITAHMGGFSDHRRCWGLGGRARSPCGACRAAPARIAPPAGRPARRVPATCCPT